MDTRKDRKNCGCSENHSGRNEPQRGAGGKGHGEKSLGHLSISRDTRESRESRDHRSSSSNCSSGCSDNLSIGPKPGGPGFISANLPDNTALGGDCRGRNAVDWQMSRDSPDQVSSGVRSTISGGKKNKATGLLSTIGGGYANIAAGTLSTVSGGGYNNAGSLSA